MQVTLTESRACACVWAQVSQLIYYSSVLAGDIQPASPPAEEAAASASESS